MRQFWCPFIFIFCFCFALQGQKTIAIFTCQSEGLKPWDCDSIREGISGSEEAVIYLSKELAALDYRVLVFGSPPAASPHALATANPRFVDYSYRDAGPIDVAISWRMPHIATELRQVAKKVYFWPHDICSGRVAPEQIRAYDDVLWLSQWQREQWVSINPEFAPFTVLFGNGIDPLQFQPVSERANPYSCIYGSNYARGLDVLLDSWPVIKGQFPRATLDIYYGWQHWGCLTPEKEANLRAQLERLAALDVKEHGCVGHEELNRAFARASFWTYPCTASETFCITALRAQLSGAVPVIIDATALSETTRHGIKCNKVEDYPLALQFAMQQAPAITVSQRKMMGDFVLKEFTWKHLARQAATLFEQPSQAISLDKATALSLNSLEEAI